MKQKFFLYILVILEYLLRKNFFVSADVSPPQPFYQQCLSDEYIDQDKQCVKCNSNCRECTFSFYVQSQHTCTLCSNQYYYDLTKSECVSNCEQGKKRNTLSNICEQCAIPSCAKCSDDINVCSECVENYILQNNQCVYEGEEDLLFEKQLLSLTGERERICHQEINTPSTPNEFNNNSRENMNNIIQRNSPDSFCIEDTIVCPMLTNELSNQDQIYIYSLVDEINMKVYLFTQYKVNLYTYPSLQLESEGRNILPNAAIRSCGFVENDQKYFYCTYGSNLIIRYGRSRISGEILHKFEGKAIFIQTYRSSSQIWKGGRIFVQLDTSIQVFDIKQNKQDTIKLPKGTNQFFIEANSLQFIVERDSKNLYLLNTQQDNFIPVKDQFDTLYDIVIIEDINFYIFGNEQYYCQWTLENQQSKSISFSSCQKLTFNYSNTLFSIISFSEKQYLSNEKMLITFSSFYQTLFVFDLLSGWSQISLIFDRHQGQIISYYFTDRCLFVIQIQGIISKYPLQDIPITQSEIPQQIQNKFLLSQMYQSRAIWNFSGVSLSNIIFKFPEMIVINQFEILVINLLSYQSDQDSSFDKIKTIKSDILTNFIKSPIYEITNQIGYISAIDKSKVVGSHYIIQNEEDSYDGFSFQRILKFLLIVENFNLRAIYPQGNKSYSQSIIRLSNIDGMVMQSTYIQQLQTVILWFKSYFQIINAYKFNLMYQSPLFEKSNNSYPDTFRVQLSSNSKVLAIVMMNKVNLRAVLFILQFEDGASTKLINTIVFKQYTHFSVGNQYIVAIYSNKTKAYIYNLDTLVENVGIDIQDGLYANLGTLSLSASNQIAISYYNGYFRLQKLDDSNNVRTFQLQQKATLQSFILLKRSNSQNVLIIFTDVEILVFSWDDLNSLTDIQVKEEQRLMCQGKKEIIEVNDEDISADDTGTSQNYLYVKSDGQLICIVNLLENNPFSLKKIVSKVYVSGINILRRNETINEFDNSKLQLLDIIAIRGLSSTYLYDRSDQTQDYRLYFDTSISCTSIALLQNKLICKNSGVKETYLLPTNKIPFLIKFNIDLSSSDSNSTLDYFTYLPSKQIIIMKQANEKFKSVLLNTKQEIEYLTYQRSSLFYSNLFQFQDEIDPLFGFYYDEMINVFISIQKNSILTAYSISQNGKNKTKLYQFTRDQLIYIGVIQIKSYIIFWVPQTNSILCLNYAKGEVVIESQSPVDKTKADKSLKLYDFNDKYLYILIFRTIIKYSFETGKQVNNVSLVTSSNDQLIWFSQIYVTADDSFLFLLNQLDILIVNAQTLDIEVRRFQTEPEYFNPTFTRQLNLITLMPTTSSKVYFIKLPNSNIQASNLSVYQSDFQYSIYTRYIDVSNKIMCLLTVDSVIHFVDLFPLLQEKSSNSSQVESAEQQQEAATIIEESINKIQEVTQVKESLQFSLHELLEDLVNSNGQENPNQYNKISLIMLYSQDIFFVTFLRNLYVYSISRKQNMFIIRSHKQPIIKVLQVNDLLLLTGDSTGVYLWSIEEMIAFKSLVVNMRNLQNVMLASNYIDNNSTFTFYNQEKSQLFIIDKETAKIQKRISIQQDIYVQNYFSNNSWQKLKNGRTIVNPLNNLNQTNEEDQNQQQKAILVISLGNDFLFFNQDIKNNKQMPYYTSFKQLIGFSNNTMYYMSQRNNLYAFRLETQKSQSIAQIKYNYQVVQSYTSFINQNQQNKIGLNAMQSQFFVSFSNTTQQIEQESNEIFLILDNGQIAVIDYRADPYSTQQQLKVIQIFNSTTSRSSNEKIISSMQITPNLLLFLSQNSQIILMRYIPQYNNTTSSNLTFVQKFSLPQVSFNNLEFDHFRERVLAFSSINDSIYLLNYLPYISADSSNQTVQFQITPMQQVSNNINQFLISDDMQYYIIFSHQFINIYYASDFKKKVSINQIFYQSQIQSVKILTNNILFVNTQTEIVLFILHNAQPSYQVSHNICFSNPHLYYFTISRSSESDPLINLQLYLHSHSGFTRLMFPIDITQIDNMQRLKNIQQAQQPEPSCLRSDMFMLRSQIAAQSNTEQSISKLFQQGNNKNSSKTYDCLLSFDLIYSPTNSNYIMDLFYSIEQINYKSVQKYIPRTVKVKVPQALYPQFLDFSANQVNIGNNQMFFYSDSLEKSTLLINQYTIFDQLPGSSLFLFNLTFYFDSKVTPYPNVSYLDKNRQLQLFEGPSKQNNIKKSITLNNRYRFSLKRIRFINSNNQYQFYFQNISRSFTDQIFFENFNFTFQNFTNWDRNQTFNKTKSDFQYSYQNYQQFNYNKTQSLISFIDLQSLKSTNIIVRNITCTQNRPYLMHVERVNKVTISNITIEDTQTDNLKIFSFRQVEQLIISNITVRNIKVKNFNLFLFQNIQNLTLQNITIINLQQQITIRQYFNRNYIMIMQGVIFSNIQDFTIQNSKNSFFLQADILMLPTNEIIVGNQNITLINIKITNVTYNISDDPNINEIQVLQAAFLKLICKNVVMNQVNITKTYFDPSIISIQSDYVLLNKVLIQKYAQFPSYRNPLCINLLISQYLELINIDFIDNRNLCVDVMNTKLVNILNTRFQSNQIYSLQQTDLQLSLIKFNKVNYLNATNLTLLENYSEQTTQSFIYILNVQIFSIIESKYFSNLANDSSGGVITIKNDQNLIFNQYKDKIRSNITQTQFFNNSSPNHSAGCIFISNVDFDIIESSFTDNQALIGGAIRIISKDIVPMFYIQYLREPKSFSFLNNTATFYGDNIGFYPKEIRIIQEEQNPSDQNLTIGNFRSGDRISDLQIQYFDYEDNQIFLTDDGGRHIELIDEQQKYSLILQTNNDKIFIPSSQFKLDFSKRSYILSLTAVIEPLQSQKLVVSTQEQFPSLFVNQKNIFQLKQKQLNKEFNIVARVCEQGEIYSKQNNISVCDPCPEGKYSFSKPLIDDISTNQCKICPPYSIFCQKNTVNLKNGYWRLSEQSELVYQCDENTESCRAEDPTSIHYCSEGYLGPMCNSCDIEGKVWGERYSRISTFHCRSCKFYGIQIAMLIGFLFLTIFYLVFLMRQNMICTIKKIQALYLKRLGMIRFGKSAQFERNSILSKMLMHYAQIVLIVINCSKFKIPSFFDVFQVGGDPIMNIYYSLDCMLVHLNVQIVFARIVWAIFYIFFLVCIGAIFFAIKYCQDKSKKKQLSYYTCFCSMAVKMVLIYSFPSLLTQLARTMTCVEIDSNSYSLADQQFSCQDNQYKVLSRYFVLPLFFLLVVVIPLIYLLRIRRIVQTPFRISLLKSFGFLFYDYKQKAYYWEILKLQLKALIIVSITLLHSYVFNKLLITLVLLMLYIFLHLKVQPYKMYEFNKLDFLAHLICCFTIVFILISMSTPFTPVKYISFCIIVLINSFFIIKLLKMYFSGIIIPIDSLNRTYFQKAFYLLKKLSPKLFNCIKLQKQNSFKILLLWHTLSLHVNDKKEIFKEEYKSLQSSQQLSNIRDQLPNQADKYEGRNESKIKKLIQIGESNCENGQSFLQYDQKSRVYGILQNNSYNTSQIELSIQENKETLQPRYQLSLKNQIKSLNNFNFPSQSLDSPTQVVNFKLSQQHQTHKYSDSDTDRVQAEGKMINLISTNIGSNITQQKGTINAIQSAHSLHSCSNMLSQKSLERQSSNLNQPSILQPKRSYIQKAILLNRMKDREFSIRSPIKRESLKKNTNILNPNYRKASASKTYKKQMSAFSNTNQQNQILQGSQNNSLAQDSITQNSEIISPSSLNQLKSKNQLFQFNVQNSVIKEERGFTEQKIQESQDLNNCQMEKLQELSISNSIQISNNLKNVFLMQKSLIDNPSRDLLNFEGDKSINSSNNNQIGQEQFQNVNERFQQQDSISISSQLQRDGQINHINIPKESEKLKGFSEINQKKQENNLK